jgi:ABC-type glycerol-3-phosphate transport system permease component
MTRERGINILRYAILAVIVAATLYPIVWMFLASTKTNSEVFTGAGLSPGTAGLKNYESSFSQRPFLLYLVNSLFAALVSVSVTVIFGCFASYSFTKLPFRASNVLWVVVLASTMIPIEAIAIPLYLQVNSFGWINSYAGIVIPTALNAAGIFIIRQAMLSIPDDFIEAARVDGASEPRILFSIVMPMLAPSMTVAAVLTFNLSWNSYLWPLIVTSDDGLKTLPLGMAAFEKTFYTLYGEIMAVSVFGTIPLVLFFMMFQKYFIESAATAELK